MGNTAPKSKILNDPELESLKKSTGASEVQPSSPKVEGAKKEKKSDETHPSYTDAEIFSAVTNFKVIREFLEKYHKALGDKNVDQFLANLDEMKPLKDDDSKKFLQDFNGSEGLAMQQLQSHHNVLIIWERESLARYLTHKSEQNRYSVTETTLDTIHKQEEQREFFYSRYDQYIKYPPKKDGKGKFVTKLTVTLTAEGEPDKEMPIKEAMALVRERKDAIDKLVHVEALHYRAIRELLRINKSNIALIQYLKPTFDESSSSTKS